MLVEHEDYMFMVHLSVVQAAGVRNVVGEIKSFSFQCMPPSDALRDHRIQLKQIKIM